MTEKEKLIARLNELGTQLNREVSTSGTIQELTMRIAELEEELDGDAISFDGESDGQNAADSTDSDVTGAEKVKAEAGTKGDRVSVETLATLHVEALHATRNESVSIVEPGVIIRVSERDADELISKGLAREV
ncbi:DNA-packaging protein [Salmonella enterica subsp. enterica serovar Typhimurium]|uniref:DNA-packaging protein FI n=1 Tax=Salmonella enterica TaxID=28901 RepID=UPI00077DF46D|nr:DNA-packaging protein FI [Salmonella enterica]KYI63479.1 DNA-packaging protein [Salmonella enterica subsp. enterica serovar Typhimurium]KYI63517.1 DNA-packaging protein [Salmonella enterica subsp. enterica serovar Typhimurium]